MDIMKEKQIDEMAKLICTYPQCVNYNNIGGCKIAECQTVDIAENLYNAGYRKASDVAREIFAEIEKIVAKEIRRCDSMREKCIDDPIYWEGGRHSLQQARYWLAELKKKYTESEDTE